LENQQMELLLGISICRGLFHDKGNKLSHQL